MKKIIPGLLFITSGCSQLTKDLLKDPEVKIVDVQLQKLDAQSVTVDLKLNVNNPNPIPLKLSSIGYSLKFSGEQVTEGQIDQGVDVPASGANDVTVPLTFKYNALGNLLTGLFKKTLSKEYELTGSAKVGLFSIPFNKKGQIEFKK